MLMMKVESDRPSRAQGIQWGIARISIVASTGSPSDPVVEQGLQGPHRVIVPHVLVDLKQHAGPLAGLDQRGRLAVRHRQRLLGQDAAHPAGMVEHAVDDPRLFGRRHGDVDDLDRRVVEHLLDDCNTFGARPAARPLPRRLDRPRSEPDDAEAGLGVSDQVAVADDEARADDSDPQPTAFRRGRNVSQVDGGCRFHRRLTRAAAWASCPFRRRSNGLVARRKRGRENAELIRRRRLCPVVGAQTAAERAYEITHRLKPARELRLGRARRDRAGGPADRQHRRQHCHEDHQGLPGGDPGPRACDCEHRQRGECHGDDVDFARLEEPARLAMPSPRRGQGAGGCGRPPPPPSTR